MIELQCICGSTVRLATDQPGPVKCGNCAAEYEIDPADPNSLKDMFDLQDVQHTVLPACDSAGDLQSTVDVDRAPVRAEADPPGEDCCAGAGSEAAIAAERL